MVVLRKYSSKFNQAERVAECLSRVMFVEWRRTLLVVLYERFPFIGARLLAAISSDAAVTGTNAMHACTTGGGGRQSGGRKCGGVLL